MTINSMKIPSNYQEMSWVQICKFKNTVDKLSSTNVQSKSLDDLRKTAEKLDASIKTSPPFFMFVKDCIKLNIFKKWVLKYIIPRTIKKIEHMQRIKGLWGQITGREKKVRGLWKAQLQAHHQLKVLKNAQKYFENNRDRFFPMTSTGFWMAQANRFFKDWLPEGITKEDIMKQIDDFFKDKIQLIQTHKKPIALPAWHHATRQGTTAAQIIAMRTLKQSINGAAGPGVYVSTRHEKSGYGDYCFALDHKIISSRKASYFEPGNAALWVSVHEDVPVTQESISHIIVSSFKMEKNLKQLLQKRSANSQLGPSVITAACPIIYHAANEILIECFQKTREPLILPTQWSRAHSPTRGISLPFVKEARVL